MPSNRWVTFQKPEPGREYLALLSLLPLKGFAALPMFLGHLRRIQAQLKHSPGLVGYSLYARPFQLRFWTLSVWESAAAVTEFVNRRPQGDVMAALQEKMGETRFVQWKMMGLQYPPSWHDAFKHR